MESRVFIRTATALIAKIAASHQTIGTADELRAQRDAIQKEITNAFTGLANPTLPSALKLRDAATRAGYTVNTLVSQRIQQADREAWYG